MILSELLSSILLIFVALSFLAFLSTIAKGRRSRSVPSILLFVIANVIIIVLLFANLFKWNGLHDSLAPDAVAAPASLLTSIYFSFVTWTTLGYGDVVPTAASRPIAAFEAMTGYVVMALLVAVFVIAVQD